MIVINTRNVNGAYASGMTLLRDHGVLRCSRVGDVLEMESPVTTVYTRPRERVLFGEKRDANPFFHIAESMWMLAGRNDVAYVAHYAKRMTEYTDDGITIHGAYGARWRNYMGFDAQGPFYFWDQLPETIKALKRSINDRRCVVAMWDPNRDFQRDGRDFPCNTHIYFKRKENGQLDMTVCNRSNDIIWGAYGANAVHMSFLHEYMAQMIGCPVGIYRQVSDSYHAYVGVFNELVDTAVRHRDMYPKLERDGFDPKPLVNSPDKFDHEVRWAVEGHFSKIQANRWLLNVFEPMMQAWEHYKHERLDSAMAVLDGCAAVDWRIAGKQWMAKRALRRGIDVSAD